MNFYKLSDFYQSQQDRDNKNHPILKQKHTTVLDYFKATEKDSPAGKMIDDGFEPYLMDRDSYEMGMFPFIEVWDVGTRLSDEGKVTLFTINGGKLFEPDTLLFWR